MGIDAVVLLRPKNKKLLRKHAKALTPLDDGTVLFSTYMRYAAFEAEPEQARRYLEAELGAPLAKVQDDSRGALVFPDISEPRAKTYAGIIDEVEDGAFWLPLDGSADAGAHAAHVAAKREAAAEKLAGQQGSFLAAVENLMARDVPPDAPDAAALLARLGELAGSFVKLRPDTHVWCVLVKRKKAIAKSALEGATNDVHVLPDKSTAIYGTNYEDLDSLAWRLADQYTAWTSEHEDKRGIPAFGSDAFARVRRAREEGQSALEEALINIRL